MTHVLMGLPEHSCTDSLDVLLPRETLPAWQELLRGTSYSPLASGGSGACVGAPSSTSTLGLRLGQLDCSQKAQGSLQGFEVLDGWEWGAEVQPDSSLLLWHRTDPSQPSPERDEQGWWHWPHLAAAEAALRKPQRSEGPAE
ncbi:hypothetical protein ABPG75_004678 [Micractinium tetrahymenae]